MPTLHVTNGDHAADAIRAAGIEGECLPWRDVLHDGPVPAGLDVAALAAERARHIAGCGWGPVDEVHRSFAERDARLDAARGDDEVVLWFEHDLYDQLQLAQVLARTGRTHGTARVTLALADDYLGPMAPDALRALYEARRPAKESHVGAARTAWAALTAGTPRALEAAIRSGALDPLPRMAPALRRLLEELPDARAGLARTERQALEAIANGATTARAAYPASHHAREDPIWLGDASFGVLLARLAAGPHPLVRFTDDSPVTPPASGDDSWWTRPLALTPDGTRVLAGDADHVALNAPDRWLGGTRLDARAPWRWDGASVVEHAS